ncbi:hypothetical protein VTN00DRAFT_8533 [Thermoascus crustaceus]|uniref:uncharacterized protein n=1 Tax=Thermoascus crustaceus TaxID=5088 RepID=UPI0037440D46
MPRWGRPPGARLGRQARRRATQWEDEDGRIEEVESGEEDYYYDQDMLLDDPRCAAKVSQRGRRELQKISYEHEEEMGSSDGEDYDLDDNADSTMAYAVQLAMMDKEDWLVENALERIRRAHMLGKKNVRLSQEEKDALERRRLRTQAANDSQSKKGGTSRPSPDDKRKSKSKSKAEKTTNGTSEKENKRRSTSGTPKDRHATPSSQSNGSSGKTKNTPPGYYSSPGVRESSSSQRPRTPPMHAIPPQQLNASPHAQYQPSLKRHSAIPDMSAYSSSRSQPLPRPLPDDSQWTPMQRPSSAAVPRAQEHLEYEHYVPLDARHGFHARPTATGYTPYRPTYANSANETSSSSTSSDPPSPQRAPPESTSSEEDSSSEEDDDDETEDEEDEKEVEVKKVQGRPTQAGNQTRTATSAAAKGSGWVRQRKGGSRK